MNEPLGYTGPAQAIAKHAASGVVQPAMYQFRTSCRLCGGPLAEVLRLPDCPLANEYWPADRAGEKQDEFPLVIAQCSSCQHVQLQCVVNPERLYSEYTYTSGVAASFRAHLEKLATDLYAAGHRTIVDIGSNDGTLLHYCRNLGMTGIGVDPARNLAAEASARGNLTIPAFFNVETAREIRKTIGTPDVVTCLNAFAHTDDLAAIADGVRELIGEKGTFVFEVAYLLDTLESGDTSTCYHEHASLHHLKPLESFFWQRGMYLSSATRIRSQGGSIRVTARARGASVSGVGGAFGDLLSREDRELPALLEHWPARIQLERHALEEELADVRGKGLAVFGAPARLTTYAHAMGLRHEDVMCVFDDEPRKIGRLTPGLHWKIVPSMDLLTKYGPRAILIASWNYADDIMARFPGYAGRWIARRWTRQVAS